MSQTNNKGQAKCHEQKTATKKSTGGRKQTMKDKPNVKEQKQQQKSRPGVANRQ